MLPPRGASEGSQFFAAAVGLFTQPRKGQALQPGPVLFSVSQTVDSVDQGLITPRAFLLQLPLDKLLASTTVSCSTKGPFLGGKQALGNPQAGLERM